MPAPRRTLTVPTRRHLGRRVLLFDELASTNDTAAALVEPGLVVVADVQSAGRGQHGRGWWGRPGGGLLLSVVLDPPPALARPVVLTAWAAVAVAETVDELTGVASGVKWPNDVLIGGRKVCGILAERRTVTVVGVGLNLNQSADEFAAAGLPAAASVRTVAGIEVEALAAAERLLGKLDAGWDRLLSGDLRTLEAAWRSRLGLVGGDVLAELADGSLVGGRLLGVEFDGIELDQGGGRVQVLRPEFVRHLRAV